MALQENFHMISQSRIELNDKTEELIDTKIPFPLMRQKQEPQETKSEPNHKFQKMLLSLNTAQAKYLRLNPNLNSNQFWKCQRLDVEPNLDQSNLQM